MHLSHLTSFTYNQRKKKKKNPKIRQWRSPPAFSLLSYSSSCLSLQPLTVRVSASSLSSLALFFLDLSKELFLTVEGSSISAGICGVSAALSDSGVRPPICVSFLFFFFLLWWCFFPSFSCVPFDDVHVSVREADCLVMLIGLRILAILYFLVHLVFSCCCFAAESDAYLSLFVISSNVIDLDSLSNEASLGF